ncbi:hypothetical protein NY08_2425 [Rhodococcus sp. B7740]|nr:hypothetical protein NY08_2425 [Rhodococcus sp. B7740]
MCRPRVLVSDYECGPSRHNRWSTCEPSHICRRFRLLTCAPRNHFVTVCRVFQ